MWIKSKKRSLTIGLTLTLFFTVIIFRLFWIQTVQSDELTSQAISHWQNDDQILEAKRGTIYDRTKTQALAWEETAYYFVADPEQVKNVDAVANQLSPLLGISAQTLADKLSQKKKAVTLREGGKYKYSRKVFEQIIQLKKEGKISGIYGYQSSARKYQNGQAAHVLGFLNVDDQPVGGIESYYNQLLQGKDGQILYKQSQDGIMISDQPESFQPPTHGKDLVLTLDVNIQHEVEQVLDQAMKKYQSKGAIAIVANPKNGEILAMANRPSFDPNHYAETYDIKTNGNNKAVEIQYEPGSTFKIITLAAAMNEGLFHPKETFQSGSIQVGTQVFHDWKKEGWGEINYQQGVKLSSNVAFIKLQQKLGAGRLIQYIDRFGFGNVTEKLGKKTGIDLPAEGKGYFYNRPLYAPELASLAFGQGISVTPIQQVAAISAVANNGYWVKPHVLKEVWDPDTKKKIKDNRIERKRIIKDKTASQVRDILREVVTSGTAVEANIPGYQVAGKTGTAQKPKQEGGYYDNKYIVSFIGFAPKDEPEFVVYVALDEPVSEYGNVSGGTMAAPVAREILKKSLQIKGVSPDDKSSAHIK